MRVADSIAYCRIGVCSKDRDVSQLDASINGHVGCKYVTFSSCLRACMRATGSCVDCGDADILASLMSSARTGRRECTIVSIFDCRALSRREGMKRCTYG